MAMIKRTGRKGAMARFVQARKGTAVKTGKHGGKNLGTPTHCPSKRAASNLRSY